MIISAMKQALEALENVRGYDVENLYGLDDEIDALRTAIEAETAQGQEPFCYHDGRNIVGKEFADHSDVFPLYTTPPAAQQREWVGLTDDELCAAYRRGRDSMPKPHSGWDWVDDHTPGLREVQREIMYAQRENNGSTK
jgi:hypothetical protein